MCNYIRVHFNCGHDRCLVKEWCTYYEDTHRRCPPRIVDVGFRYQSIFQINRQSIIANS
ncbi:hypothetical protein DL98DRAFT_436535 [Cadophora sp. DSE1049]|nr:hypothetical protein DL98DRAFT_436535 [Cadophora sp. DSE1049]